MPRSWELPYHYIHRLKKRTHQYCLCIPVINEGRRFKKQLQLLEPYTKMVDVIICDGGSTDHSVEVKYLKKQHVTALLTKDDEGKLSAQLRMGYAFALRQDYKGVITMDGNGKDGVDAIPKFIEKLQAGYDYVQGSRFIRGGKAVNTPWPRHVANRYLHAPVLSLAARHFWFTDTTNGFRAYSTKYLRDQRVKPFRKIFQCYELLAYLTVRASQLGYKVTEVPVTRAYPQGEVPTKISFFKGNLDLLTTLFKTAVGTYHPRLVS